MKRLLSSEEPKETMSLPNIDKDWMSCTKVKVSEAQCSVGMCDDKRSQRYLAKLQLYVPIEDAMGRNGGVELGLRSLRNLGRP